MLNSVIKRENLYTSVIYFLYKQKVISFMCCKPKNTNIRFKLAARRSCTHFLLMLMQPLPIRKTVLPSKLAIIGSPSSNVIPTGTSFTSRYAQNTNSQAQPIYSLFIHWYLTSIKSHGLFFFIPQTLSPFTITSSPSKLADAFSPSIIMVAPSSGCWCNFSIHTNS